MKEETVFEELGEFFNLEVKSKIFREAILPKSCGGGYEFEQLAAYGDRIFDIHLISYFIDIGYQSKGDITQERQKIHKEEIIVKIAKLLNIDKILLPISGQKIEDKDISECIESLIGANYKINGIEDSRKIVFRLIEIYNAKQLYRSEFSSGSFQDPKSTLNQLYQSVGQIYSNELLEPSRIGGSDHDPQFQVDKTLNYNEMEYHVTSKVFNNKDKARTNAALIYINQILGNPTETVIAQGKKDTVEAFVTYALTDEKLLFEYFKIDMPMKLTTRTGENILEWVKRKIRKPFSMIVLLSARLSNFQSTAWGCSINAGELTILTIRFDDHNYFSVGFGSSKSQARKEAAKNIIDQAPLLTWLSNNFSEYRI